MSIQIITEPKKLSDGSIAFDIQLPEQIAPAPDYKAAGEFVRGLRQLCEKHRMYFESTFCGMKYSALNPDEPSDPFHQKSA